MIRGSGGCPQSQSVLAGRVAHTLRRVHGEKVAGKNGGFVTGLCSRAARHEKPGRGGSDLHRLLTGAITPIYGTFSQKNKFEAWWLTDV